MKKFLIISALCLGLTGCGIFERGTANITGFSRMCVDGVAYLQFASGATVAYNPDGTIKLCK